MVTDSALHSKNNLPDIVQRWFNRNQETTRTRTDQSFLVPKAEIVQNNYDLSINRYKQVVYQEQRYDPPQVILQRIKELQKAMDEGIKQLEQSINAI